MVGGTGSDHPPVGDPRVLRHRDAVSEYVMRYRKKPIEIEATPVEFILAASKLDDSVLPDWVQEGIRHQKLKIYEEVVVVQTLEGNMRGGADDWLIQGINGELYPCANEIFLKTYERVEE